MMSRPIQCECAKCLPENRRAAPVVAVCVRCGDPGGTTVGHLIQTRQKFLCGKHRGARGRK